MNEFHKSIELASLCQDSSVSATCNLKKDKTKFKQSGGININIFPGGNLWCRGRLPKPKSLWSQADACWGPRPWSGGQRSCWCSWSNIIVEEDRMKAVWQTHRGTSEKYCFYTVIAVDVKFSSMHPRRISSTVDCFYTAGGICGEMRQTPPGPTCQDRLFLASAHQYLQRARLPICQPRCQMRASYSK